MIIGSFQLFVDIEKKVHVYLTKHFRNRESNMELLQQNVIEKVVGCDDVQFQWSLLSVNIENAEDEQLVIQDIGLQSGGILWLQHGWKHTNN